MTITLNLNELKSTRTRTAHRQYIDSFEVVQPEDDGSFEPNGPESGADIVTAEKFDFADFDELKSKIQSACNAASQGNERKFKVHTYASDSLLVIRLN